VLAVGDADFQRKCFEYFRQLKRNKKTVVFISHDMSAIEEFCDRAALIDNSKLSFIGSPTETAMLYRSIMAAHGHPIEHEDQHVGTGEVKITKVEILQNNRAVKQISEGEQFDIAVTYRAKKAIKHPVFGVAVVSANDIIVAGPHTQEAGVNLGTIKGEGRVTASFKMNPLNSGAYTFMASCFNEDISAPYDFINNAGQLEVVGKKRYGVVSLEPEWTTDKKIEKKGQSDVG
jgi:ABC-type sugar transport system ATPase subunit